MPLFLHTSQPIISFHSLKNKQKQETTAHYCQRAGNENELHKTLQNTQKEQILGNQSHTNDTTQSLDHLNT